MTRTPRTILVDINNLLRFKFYCYYQCICTNMTNKITFKLWMKPKLIFGEFNQFNLIMTTKCSRQGANNELTMTKLCSRQEMLYINQLNGGGGESNVTVLVHCTSSHCNKHAYQVWSHLNLWWQSYHQDKKCSIKIN